MWYIINSMVNMDNTLAREAGGYHGDLQPQTVLLNKNSKVKMIDSGLVHLGKDSYKRMLYEKGTTRCAVSPQLLD